MSFTKPIKAGRPEFQVYRPREDQRRKLLATCFFCGKEIRRKGDLERVPVLSDGSEVKVPGCHSCFLTAKRSRGLPTVRVKARGRQTNSRFIPTSRGSALDTFPKSARLFSED